MPVTDNRGPAFPVLPTLLVMNMFPLIGVLFFEWSFFAIIYLYWWETVILSVFNVFKMKAARKKADAPSNIAINGKPMTLSQTNSKVFLIPTYIGIRHSLYSYTCFLSLYSLVSFTPRQTVRCNRQR